MNEVDILLVEAKQIIDERLMHTAAYEVFEKLLQALMRINDVVKDATEIIDIEMPDLDMPPKTISDFPPLDQDPHYTSKLDPESFM